MLDGFIALFLLAALAVLSVSVTLASKMVAVAVVIFSGLYFLSMAIGTDKTFNERTSAFITYMKRPEASFSFLEAA